MGGYAGVLQESFQEVISAHQRGVLHTPLLFSFLTHDDGQRANSSRLA
jgi:hypothetical protein